MASMLFKSLIQCSLYTYCKQLNRLLKIRTKWFLVALQLYINNFLISSSALILYLFIIITLIVCVAIQISTKSLYFSPAVYQSYCQTSKINVSRQKLCTECYTVIIQSRQYQSLVLVVSVSRQCQSLVLVVSISRQLCFASKKILCQICYQNSHMFLVFAVK